MRLVSILALAIAAGISLPVRADFAIKDLTTLDLSRFDMKLWEAKKGSDRVTLACVPCGSVTAIDIQIGADDGTGDRVRSGQTTAATMAEIGRANAARNPGGSTYFGATAIRRGTAVGFRQEARALGQFVVTYILWDGGQRMILRGFAPERATAARIAREGYEKIASQIAR